MKYHRFENYQYDKFDMTPLIDVVFLLIIFFMIVCQFIVAENFEVEVPEDIYSAVQSEDTEHKQAIVTVMFDEQGGIDYAIGSEVISVEDVADIPAMIAEKIDKQSNYLNEEVRVVSLRIDKDIPFKHSQYALAGISQSRATDMKLSVKKKKNTR